MIHIGEKKAVHQGLHMPLQEFWFTLIEFQVSVCAAGVGKWDYLRNCPPVGQITWNKICNLIPKSTDIMEHHLDGLVQNCSNLGALAMELNNTAVLH